MAKHINRNPLRKLAMRMMTAREKMLNISPFFSTAWILRKEANRRREAARFQGIGRMNATQRRKLLRERKAARLAKQS